MKKLLLALAIPLGLYALIEGALRLFSIAETPRFFVEKADEQGRVWLETNLESPWGGLPFEPNRFLKDKEAGTVRVFCLGGSTTNGFPFARHSSFSKWLEVRLEALLEGHDFEVIKMGYDAKSARPIAELFCEVVEYDPDLIVVYTGHNQFLAQNLGPVKNPTADWWRRHVFELRTARLVSSMVPQPERDFREPAKNPPRVIEDQPFLSAEELEQGYVYFEDGLDTMIEAAEARSVPLLFCLPASNLADYAPRRSHFDPSLDGESRERYRSMMAQVEERLAAEDFEEARALLTRLEEIDATPALLHFRWGEAWRVQDAALARTRFERARDEDGHPSRATSRTRDILRSKTEGRCWTADCREQFRNASRDGLPGEEAFVDNCHPTLAAQNLIAEAILQRLAEVGWIEPSNKWAFDREPPIEEYHRRMGLDMSEVATDFAREALINFLRLVGRTDSVDPLVPAEAAYRFAFTHDQDNPTAHLGMAVVEALRERPELAASHLRRSRKGDPKVFSMFVQLASGTPELRQILTTLESLPNEDPGASSGGGSQ